MSHSGLLFGATSLLGFNIARIYGNCFIPYVPPGSRKIQYDGKKYHWQGLNLESTEWIKKQFESYQPEVLIYCHGVCDVSKCQENPSWAREINVHHVERLLEVIPDDVRLVYVSSDHVFGEDGNYDESSMCCPVSIYGETRVESEKLLRNRDNCVVIRPGLAIGPSPYGRTGHYDWLKYRINQGLPITIVKDEGRSVVWAEDLANRVIKIAKSEITGICHVPATRMISRIKLANYLLDRWGIKHSYKIERRIEQPAPHLGMINIVSQHEGELFDPLISVIDDCRELT